MEVDNKKLFQLIEEFKEEQRVERATETETIKLKIDAIQHSILQLLEKKTHMMRPQALIITTINDIHNSSKGCNLIFPILIGTML